MAGGRNWWTVVGLLSLLVASARTIDVKFTDSEYTVYAMNGVTCGDEVAFRVSSFDPVSVRVVPKNGTGKYGEDFEIEERKFDELSGDSQAKNPIPIKLLNRQPTRKEGSWNFYLTLECVGPTECDVRNDAHVTVVQSGNAGVHFVSPIFRGFVNESLPIWLIKNESVPLDVSVVLSRGQKEMRIKETFLSSEMLKVATFNIPNKGTFNAKLEVSDSCVAVGQPARIEVSEPLSNLIDKIEVRLRDTYGNISLLNGRIASLEERLANATDEISQEVDEILQEVEKTSQEVEKTSQGEGKTPQGEGKTPQGEGKTSQGEGKTSQGEGKTPQGEGKTPQGEGKTSQGEGKTLQGAGKTSQEAEKTPVSTSSTSFAFPIPTPTPSPGATTEGGTPTDTPTDPPTDPPGDTSGGTPDVGGGSGMNWQLALVAIIGLLVVAVAGYVGYYNRKKLYDWVTGRGGGGGGGGGGRGGRRKHYRRLPQSVHDAMVHND